MYVCIECMCIFVCEHVCAGVCGQDIARGIIGCFLCALFSAKTQKEIEQIIAEIPAKQNAAAAASSKPLPITVEGELCAQGAACSSHMEIYTHQLSHGLLRERWNGRKRALH